MRLAGITRTWHSARAHACSNFPSSTATFLLERGVLPCTVLELRPASARHSTVAVEWAHSILVRTSLVLDGRADVDVVAAERCCARTALEGYRGALLVVIHVLRIRASSVLRRSAARAVPSRTGPPLWAVAGSQRGCVRRAGRISPTDRRLHPSRRACGLEAGSLSGRPEGRLWGCPRRTPGRATKVARQGMGIRRPGACPP